MEFSKSKHGIFKVLILVNFKGQNLVDKKF